MTHDPSMQPPVARPRSRPRAAWAVALVALIGFIVAWLVGRDLFVLAEARGFAIHRPPLDPLQFLVFPELGWANGRLLALGWYEATGAVCGVAASCFDVSGAMLTAAAVAVLVVHTRQVTRSLGVGVLAGLLWATSPTLIGISLWQGTWFDLLAFILFLATCSVWWEVTGRTRLGGRASVLFVAGTMLLMALAFNAKETTWPLAIVLPLIALLRGMGVPGGVRRNLLLVALPVAYAAWFIVHGLTHMDQGFAAKQFHTPIVDGMLPLVQTAMGLRRDFMYVDQQGDQIAALRSVAGDLYLVAGALLAVLLVAGAMAVLRRRPRTGAAGSDVPPVMGRSRIVRVVLGWPGELYLAGVTIIFVLLLAPTKAPTAYYYSLPAWALTALVLSLIRRAAGALSHGRVAAAVLIATWLAAHILVLGSLLVPGSTWQQLVVASGRMRELGATLRAALADREGGPVVWRTIGVPPTDFYILRDPGGSKRSEDEAWTAGGDLVPYLFDDVRVARRFTALTEGTLDQIRAGMPGLAEERQTVIVIDADYRLMLLLYEGEVIFDAATPGA